MISSSQCTVYKSSLVSKRFLTKNGAINAETKAIIKNKYPSESAEYDSGHMINPPFHWSDLPRSKVLFRRIRKLVVKHYKDNQ